MCVITKAQRAHNLMRKSYRFSPRLFHSFVGHLIFRGRRNKSAWNFPRFNVDKQRKCRSCFSDFCESCVSSLCNRKRKKKLLYFFKFLCRVKRIVEIAAFVMSLVNAPKPVRRGNFCI